MKARLDHIILRVADIRVAHAGLLALGFPEAWPVGPFWRPHLTSGIALGELNLELFQPADGGPEFAYADTLVFAGEAPVGYQRSVKTASDPELLRLRGFPGDREELICRNGFPPDGAALDHFFCDYVPSLRERLAIEGPFGPVTEVVVEGVVRPTWVEARVRFEPGDEQRVIEIVIGSGERFLDLPFPSTLTLRAGPPVP